jgi:hypothetical protein
MCLHVIYLRVTRAVLLNVRDQHMNNFDMSNMLNTNMHV